MVAIFIAGAPILSEVVTYISTLAQRCRLGGWGRPSHPLGVERSRATRSLLLLLRVSSRMRCSRCGNNAAEVVAVARPRPRGIPKNPHWRGFPGRSVSASSEVHLSKNATWIAHDQRAVATLRTALGSAGLAQ